MHYWVYFGMERTFENFGDLGRGPRADDDVGVRMDVLGACPRLRGDCASLWERRARAPARGVHREGARRLLEERRPFEVEMQTERPSGIDGCECLQEACARRGDRAHAGRVRGGVDCGG